MNNKNTIKEYIAQFILIVFSVVLGLYLSERIEEKKQVQESEELLATIKAEVKDNIKLMKYWAPYHKEIKMKLDTLAKDSVFIKKFITDRDVFFEEILTRGTFMGVLPSSDAWEIAKNHPLIVKIEYNKYLALSKIYNQQELTFEPALKMFELFESKDVNTTVNAKGNLELMYRRMHEVVAREDQLMEFYKLAEVRLGL